VNNELTAAQFPEFYRALNGGHDPFPWQTRLAGLVCSGKWPKSLDLPTATGKTSCIDIALFAMAVRGCGPRRVFFVIDRRVVVDQAFEHMEHIAAKLAKPMAEILVHVAGRLRDMGGSASEPVTAYRMRGGVYRDDTWVRSPLQPTLIASTVDQVGSRILFRGYGASDKTWPMHAALVANDSLILLDEAHCSKAFAQTLARIKDYRGVGWAERDIGTPFEFVEMTATPPETAEPFQLNEDDYSHEVLRKRLFASKPARLAISKARAKEYNKLAESLVAEALQLSKEPGISRIAVMVNRVRTARRVYEILKQAGHRTHLLIGRMRPVDRESLDPDIEAMRSGNRAVSGGGPVFVVATQCLEVGADLDFDGLVTECASIDALLQRFGRLDRLGELSQRGARAQGRVVASTPMTDDKYVDTVYQGALSKTWNWLVGLGETVDFGICSEAGATTVRERLQTLGMIAEDLRRKPAPAPALLPAHLDLLVQTSPRPALDLDPQVFLHGKENSYPEVQVIWRKDLDPEHPEEWPDIVALCPPVSNEAMPVPLRDFQRWVAGEQADAGSDLEGADVAEDQRGRNKQEREVRCPVLRWRGDQSDLFRPGATAGDELGYPREFRAGDTLILSEASRGWEELGHIPAEPVDAAERARAALRRGWVLRLFPPLIERWPDTVGRAEVLACAVNANLEVNDLIKALESYKANLPESDWLWKLLDMPWGRPNLEAYPERDGKHVGWILSKRYFEADFGQDESSASRAVLLSDHLGHVKDGVQGIAKAVLGKEGLTEQIWKAAELHDCGKADLRFQALLRGGDPLAARFAPLLAKGEQSSPSRTGRQTQWRRSALPDGFRHELVSLALIRCNSEPVPDDLVLHLVASHHGRCRPFAPVVGGEGEVRWNTWRLTREQAKELAAHRIDSGVADRFWRLTRRYGWWGLAYLETLLRLGDWKASKGEVENERDPATGA
jgi:CRISPR-associated endonuclease/helicase Cas3